MVLFFVPFALLALTITMYTLGSTADVYLSPALEAISDKLGCSESLAGVTLLALGNGAPDMFAAISAGGTTESSVNLMMSNLFGAVFFISTCVILLVLRASLHKGAKGKKMQVTKQFFIRDSIFLLITSAYILVIGLIVKSYNFYLAVGHLVLYFIFVVTVVIQSGMHARAIK